MLRAFTALLALLLLTATEGASHQAQAAASETYCGVGIPGPAFWQPCRTFIPIAGGYATLSTTGTTSNVALPGAANGLNVGVINTGTDIVFVCLGGSAVTCTTGTGIPVAPNYPVTIPLGTNTYLAGVANSGTQVLELLVGNGQISQRNKGTVPVPPTQTITIANISGQTQSVAFQITGTYTGTAPTGIDYQVDSGSFTALTSPTISGGNWSSASGAISIATLGSHTVTVREQPHTYVIATSNSFTVSAGSSCSSAFNFSVACNSQYLGLL